MTQTFVTILLGMLLGIQPVATDLYLSALPSIQSDLSASVQQTQLTLSSMMLAFGFSQLVLGPLSDRFGRRPVMLWGVGFFTLAAIATAFAQSIEWLITARVLQGAAMGAAVMSGRAITRDLFEPERAAIVMSKAFTALGVIALCAALLGSVITEFAGWRYTLSAMAVFGAALWALLYWRYDETLRTPNPHAMQPVQLLRNTLTIGSHSGFAVYSFISISTYCALFSFLVGSPFVLMKVLGLSKLQFGLCLMVMPLFYISGTVYCRRLLRRFGLQETTKRAAWMILLAGLAISGLAQAGVQTLWAVVLPFYLFIFAHGVMQSCGQSGSVAHFPTMAGTAAALNGFLMMVFAFATSYWMGAHFDGSALAMTSSMGFWCVLLSATAWFLVPRFGKV
jgi:MFS transporter, DHA1 family, multidrug resistance protein